MINIPRKMSLGYVNIEATSSIYHSKVLQLDNRCVDNTNLYFRTGKQYTLAICSP